MTMIVVGLDGGGSRTRALVADERGTEIVRVEGPPSAVRPGAVDASADVLAALVRDALAAAAMEHVTPKVVCAGVAGAGRDAERDALWQALSSREIADDVVVHADATVALDDAFGDGAGVLLVAGTGSVAFARGPTGTFARCGGWGPVIGDEGSGAWIGRRALSVVAAATDGREPGTALVGAILTAAEVESVEALIAWAAEATPARLAALAPAVLQTAEAGDLRANALLSIAVEELVLHVRTLGRQLFTDERAAIPVAFTGGLLTRGSPLRRRLEHRLKTAVPGAQVRAEPVDPVRGAVRGALRFLGLAPEAEAPVSA
ncbi:MAG TPA: BadF/BadG/BcrA/BcrD ATPase family protein [Gemmatimonadaceae bacterium]|nr:BadF/BadG/BcrA/BcrD ATPase family protein [Gemmatimonadaceae bacterium]